MNDSARSVPDQAQAAPSLSVVTPPLRRRMAAWLYEGVLMFGMVVLPGLIFGVLTNTRNAMDNRHTLQAVLFLVLGVYFVYFWSRGQTLAMKTWRIGIVKSDGKPVTIGVALWRYVLCWSWFLPPLAAMAPFKLSAGEVTVLLLGWVAVWALLSRFQSQGQFWHDVWAGTRLTDTRASISPPGR